MNDADLVVRVLEAVDRRFPIRTAPADRARYEKQLVAEGISSGKAAAAFWLREHAAGLRSMARRWGAGPASTEALGHAELLEWCAAEIRREREGE